MQSKKKESKTSIGPINNLPDMFAAAISLQAAGAQDTDAMNDIYNAMNARLGYQDISDVCSAVFGDTYWNVTNMNPATLAQSLVSALGVPGDEASTYAALSFTQWRGLLTRKYLNDTGVVPLTGNPCASTDIVCNGPNTIPISRLISDWNDPFWSQPKVGKNYIYTRCQNVAFDGPLTATVEMFYSEGGFNLPPSSWNQCLTDKGGDKIGSILDSNGERNPLNLTERGASEAFTFDPVSTEHVCVIAAVSYPPYFTNLPLTGASAGNWNTSLWIISNGAAAWHNVDPQVGTEDTLAFSNQDGEDEKFAFTLSCRNVPLGSKIGLRVHEDGLKFDTEEVTVTHPAQTLRKTATVPAYLKGTLHVHFEGPDGKCLPASAAAEVRMDWLLPSGHRRYADAAKLTGRFTEFAASQEIPVVMGSFTLLGSEE